MANRLIRIMASAPYQRSTDPTVPQARREAIFVITLWVICLIYTVGYCYVFGYARHPPLQLLGYTIDLSHLDRQPGDMQLIWGIPSWVLWGVAAPWFLCLVLTVWFCFWFMKDEDLGEDQEAELARRIREEAHGIGDRQGPQADPARSGEEASA